jgi:hypothetical protein
MLRTKALLALSLVTQFASCKSRLSAPTSKVKVIGGDPAASNQFPASLYIPGCSATRIGPQSILTAAHCVLDPAEWRLMSAFESGQALMVWHGPELSTAQGYRVKIAATWVHQSFKRSTRFGGDLNLPELYDMAIIHVTGLPDTIALATIKSQPIQRGDLILFTGYGCEILPSMMRRTFNGEILTSDSWSADERKLRLKFKRERVYTLDHNVAILKNRHPSDQDLGHPPIDTFSGCPGDSGSGVYALTSDTDFKSSVLVGVNSFVSHYGTAFVRLDRDSLSETSVCLNHLINDDGQQDCFVRF